MAYTLTGCLQDRTYAMVRCPVWGSEKDIREACETGQGKYTLDEPVTDPNTNVTYRNAFCAQCHGVESYTTWDQLNVTCAHFQHVLSAVSREQLLDMAKQEVNQCTVTRARPDEVVPLYCPEPTWFSDPVVNSCNVTGGWATEDYNAAFVFNCDVYKGSLLRVRKGGVTYLNLFCALCNGITLNAMQCTQLIGGSISGSEPPLSLLLGLRGSPAGDELQDVGDCSSSHWLDHANYGTCCSDRVPGRMTQAWPETTGCLEDKTYAMVRCPQSWGDGDVREACETGQGKYTVDEPVTDLSTNVTFRNAFCAQCHGVESYTAWEFSVTCTHFQFVFSASTQEEFLEMADKDDSYCFIKVVHPDDFEPSRCPEQAAEWLSAEVVDTCNVTGEWATEDYDADVEKNCLLYKSL
nr:hypothetical protein BaRGS_009673 [Batillaria attramentaria]